MIQPGKDKIAPFKPPRKALPGTRINLATSDEAIRAEALRMLGRRLAGRLRGGNTCRVLRDGQEAYPAMLDAIASARQRVVLETYILNHDRWGVRFFDALLERLRAGVEVFIIYDAFGSLEAEDLFVQLEGAGARVHAYNPFRWFEKIRRLQRRDHRKIIVVDGTVGFLGGLNIGAKYHDPGPELPFRDTHMQVHGPMVGQLEATFLELWHHATGERVARIRPALQPCGSGLGFILALTPLRGRPLLARAHQTLFRNARRRIWITNAYFIPTRRIRNALMRAARRGTDVRLLLPGPTDVALVKWASRSQYQALLAAGVKIFEYRARMLHAKSILVDDGWALVGSTNLDYRSFDFNLEVQAITHDLGAARELEDHWKADLEHSEEVTLAQVQARSWWESLLYRFAYLFRRWL